METTNEDPSAEYVRCLRARLPRAQQARDEARRRLGRLIDEGGWLDASGARSLAHEAASYADAAAAHEEVLRELWALGRAGKI